MAGGWGGGEGWGVWLEGGWGGVGGGGEVGVVWVVVGGRRRIRGGGVGGSVGGKGREVVVARVVGVGRVRVVVGRVVMGVVGVVRKLVGVGDSF